MSNSYIQNRLLEITVVECSKLKDTEWISRQDPYVNLEYGSTKFRTRTCTDGGKTPVFQEKFLFTLIQGLTEINVAVWNSNTVYNDDFIGSGKIQLQDVLARGYDDRCWPIQTRNGRFAGEVKLIMHYTPPNPLQAAAPSYGSGYMTPQPMPYSVPPPGPPPTPMYTNTAYPPQYVYPSTPYQTPLMPCTPQYPPQQQQYPPQQQQYPPPPHGYPTMSNYPSPPPQAPPYGQYGAYPAPPYY